MTITSDEVNRRADRRLELRLHNAGFEETCRLEDFDGSAAITLARRLWKSETENRASVVVGFMVYIIRGAGALRLHVLNHATGRSICGREVPLLQITRHAYMVSCQVCDNRLHYAALVSWSSCCR